MSAPRELDPVDWRGHWIAPELSGAVASAPLRITADSRYMLWMNGTEVGRRPVRSHPRRWHYDEYDVSARRVVSAVHVGSLARSRPSANPYGRLHRADEQAVNHSHDQPPISTGRTEEA
jgi:hypothetical protein